jgi:hypothetical protein
MNEYLKVASVILVSALLGQPIQAITLPFVENFEQNDGGFTTTSLNSWKWGVPSSPEGPGVARSGSQVWGTNLLGSYAPNLNATVVSPVYDLSGAVGKHLIVHWWQFLVTEPGFDFAEVQISKNGGGTWETVMGPRQGVVADHWAQQTILVDPSFATDSFRIRFRLTSDSGVAQGGFFIDDLRISAAPFAPVVPIETFETDSAGGYVASGEFSSWAHGAPKSAPGSAASGTRAWATHLNGFYNANENSRLTSPLLDLSSAVGSNLVVRWQQYVNTEKDYDWLHFEVSKDGGVNWQTLISQSGAMSTGNWLRRQAFLPPGFDVATFRLRFRLESDDQLQFDGVAIDDVEVLATSELAPVVTPFERPVLKDFPIQFTIGDFTVNYFDPDGNPLTSVVIVQLPTSGELKLDGVPVQPNQMILIENINKLTYEPTPGATGPTTFQYVTNNFFAASEPNVVTLNVVEATPQIMITAQPSSVTVNPGVQVTLSVGAVSSLPLTYQWRKGGQAITVGGNAASFVINPVSEQDEADYDVVITNSLPDSVTSTQATVSVNDPVVIDQSPGPSSVQEGVNIALSVVARGTGRLDYQWFKDEIALLGETRAILEIERAAAADAGSYRCEVSNVVGSISTPSFPLTVLLAPRIVTQPKSLGVRFLRRVTLEVEVAGAGPFTYQWFKDGVEMPGATEAQLTLHKLREISMGSYTVRVSNSWASVVSEPATLQVVRWEEVRGRYQDVLEREVPVPGETTCPGRLTIRLSQFGLVSGSLFYEGSVHPFRGLLNPELIIERVFKRGQRPDLAMRVRFDSINRTFNVTVAPVITPEIGKSSGILPRFLYHSRRNPAPQKGRYTLLLDHDATVIAAPPASAFLIGTAAKSGQVRLAGRLPSGRVITCSGLMQSSSRVPLYRHFRRANGQLAGELCGRLGFEVQALTATIDGSLIWRHYPVPGAVFMADGFVVELEADGSIYSRPPHGTAAITLPINAVRYFLEIEGEITGETPQGQSIQRFMRLTPFNFLRIEPVTDSRVKLRLNLRTGRLSGSFKDLGTGRTHFLEGVILQAQTRMGGYFKALTEPGKFTAVPYEQ